MNISVRQNLQLGFIGLGAMGYPMASHCLAGAFPVQVWNRTGAVAGKFVDQFSAGGNLRQAPDLTSLAANCNVIITCVSADQDLIDIVSQCLPVLLPDTVICDHSTTAPQTAVELAGLLAEKECHFVDAPVSGGVEGAKKGTLVTMVGGQVAIVERISPVLQCYTDKIAHMGGVGTGQACKAVNQVMVAGIAEAVSEAMALADKLKLPINQLLDILGGGAAGNWFMAHRGRTMLADEFDVGFKLALLHKDLGICENLARNLYLDLPLVKQARADFTRLMAAGEGDYDISALIHIKQGKIQ